MHTGSFSSSTLHVSISGVIIIAPLSSTISTPSQNLTSGTTGRNMLITSRSGVRVVICISGDAIQFRFVSRTHQTGRTS